MSGAAVATPYRTNKHIRFIAALGASLAPGLAFANSMPGPDYTFARDEWLAALVCAAVVSTVAGMAIGKLARISRSVGPAEQEATPHSELTESESL